MRKAKPLPRPHRQWATIQKHKNVRVGMGLCLWSDRQSAENGRDHDEDICLVRVEVIRIIKKD